MVPWKFSLRAILGRPGRAALTLLSVVIGVAVVVSVSMAVQSTRAAYQRMFAAISGRAALEVVADGGGTFDQALLAEIGRTPGVEAAAPVLRQFTVVRAGGKRVTVLVLGVDPGLEKAVRDHRIVDGTWLDGQAALVLESDLAGNLGLRAGDEVRINTGLAGLRRVPVTGVAAKEMHLVSLGYMPLEQLQELFNLHSQISSVQVVLPEGTEREAVRAAIASRLPAGLAVRPPATESQLARETLEAAEQGLRLTGGFSLLLAAFIILNTFLMNVGERRRQIAVMRAIGATRGQIAGMLVRESLAMAVAGVVLGIVLGIAGARLLTSALSEVLLASLPPAGVSPATVGLAAALGVTVTLAGAALPAIRASRLSPLEGMGAGARGDVEGGARFSVLAGTVVAGASGLGLAACIAGWLPVALAVWMAVGLLVGVVLLVPLGLGAASRAAMWIVGPLVRVEARLAHRQVLRHRARSTLTVGVLFVATATGMGMASTILDHIEDVRRWSRTVVAGDFFVRASMPDMATGLSAAVPESLEEELSGIPGVEGVGTARFAAVEAAGMSVIVIARDFDPDAPLFLDLAGGGDQQEVCRRVMQGEVVLGTVLAERAGLKQGDDLEIGRHRFRIAALANEYLVGGLAVYMERHVAARLLDIRGVDAYVVLVRPGMTDQVRRRMEPLCEQYGVVLESAADINHMIDNMSNGVNACLWGILVLGFVVASFGTVNTLTMNVLEQTREFGLLRIVAMTRWQLRKAILTQGAMIAVMGLLPGTAAGVFTAWLINLATMRATGHPVEFGFHPVLLAGCLAAGFLIVLGAAWIPAERAARLELTKALQYE